MSDGKPVEVLRGAFGGWYAVSESKELGSGVKKSTHKSPVSNGEQLEALLNASKWLDAFLDATGKTREQIADDYDLSIESMQ